MVSQLVKVPQIGNIALKIKLDRRLDGLIHHLADGIFNVLAVQHTVTLGIDEVTLLVHNIVIVKHVLTDGKIASLDALLCAFDGLGEYTRLNRHVFVYLEHIHHIVDALAAEQSHKVILKRNVESAGTGVALTSRTATELIVDTSRLVTLGTDDEQTACSSYLLGFGLDLGLEFVMESVILLTCL